MTNATKGERRFARRIETHLEDDYLCWHDVPVGHLRRYPDFVILHPNRGLLVLEVKDWKFDDLIEIDKLQIKHHFGGIEKKSDNPIQQARQCMLQLINRMNNDPQLIETTGHYQGKLVCPYGHGAVLTNITRKQLNDAISIDDQEHVLPPHLVITKDEMTESVDPLTFQEKLWGMFNYKFPNPLSLPQMDRIRWHVFPDVRIEVIQKDLFESDNTDEESTPIEISVPDMIKVMDIQQEQLARSLGEGHRVIHGVAGSGKTLILGFRCEQLAQATSKPILVLCYNVSLAASLRSHLHSRGLEEKVQVYHFHEWCKIQLSTYNIELKKSNQPVFKQQVDTVINSVDKGLIPRAQYGAVMIDEGHDFEPEWLQLVTQMVDPATDSFLLLYDDAQSIYKKKGGLKFSLSSVGIKAQGRSTILRLNYRNTAEILHYAYNFAKDVLSSDSKENDDSIPMISPESAGISGPSPVLKQHKDIKSECDFAVSCVTKWLENGEQPSDIAIIYLSKTHASTLSSKLKEHSTPHLWMKDKKSKSSYSKYQDQISILTAHSSKGLEFKKVIIIGLGQVDDSKEMQPDNTKLIYVGMTRAQRDLLILSSHPNTYTEKLARIGA